MFHKFLHNHIFCYEDHYEKFTSIGEESNGSILSKYLAICCLDIYIYIYNMAIRNKSPITPYKYLVLANWNNLWWFMLLRLMQSGFKKQSAIYIYLHNKIEPLLTTVLVYLCLCVANWNSLETMMDYVPKAYGNLDLKAIFKFWHFGNIFVIIFATIVSAWLCSFISKITTMRNRLRLKRKLMSGLLCEKPAIWCLIFLISFDSN